MVKRNLLYTRTLSDGCEFLPLGKKTWLLYFLEYFQPLGFACVSVFETVLIEKKEADNKLVFNTCLA